MPLSKKVDLNLLRVFVSAYQTQSVTKTAEQLDLTQSAVSNALN
ncbi:LysR family transcriptional regulator, partial [Photobacterium damselae]